MSENEKAANELSPEKYYELLLSRQRLQISSHKQMLVIITAHGNDPIRAMHDLKLHEMEKSVKIEKIFEYYQICPEDYYRSSRGSGVQSERAKYLDKHPEVRDELAANSAEIRALEKQVWLKMRPLWSRQQPEEAMH